MIETAEYKVHWLPRVYSEPNYVVCSSWSEALQYVFARIRQDYVPRVWIEDMKGALVLDDYAIRSELKAASVKLAAQRIQR